MHDRSSEKEPLPAVLPITDWHGNQVVPAVWGHRGDARGRARPGRLLVSATSLDPSEGGHAAEIAMIVEDEYQGRGVGTKLIRALLHGKARLEFTEIVATVPAENTGMLHLLRSTGLEWNFADPRWHHLHEGHAAEPDGVRRGRHWTDRLTGAGAGRSARPARRRRRAARKAPAKAKARSKKAAAKKAPVRRPRRRRLRSRRPRRSAPRRRRCPPIGSIAAVRRDVLGDVRDVAVEHLLARCA